MSSWVFSLYCGGTKGLTISLKREESDIFFYWFIKVLFW